MLQEMKDSPVLSGLLIFTVLVGLPVAAIVMAGESGKVKQKPIPFIDQYPDEHIFI